MMRSRAAPHQMFCPSHSQAWVISFIPEYLRFPQPPPRRGRHRHHRRFLPGPVVLFAMPRSSRRTVPHLDIPLGERLRYLGKIRSPSRYSHGKTALFCRCPPPPSSGTPVPRGFRPHAIINDKSFAMAVKTPKTHFPLGWEQPVAGRRQRVFSPSRVRNHCCPKRIWPLTPCQVVQPWLRYYPRS